jgi:hypothetical protein
MAMKILLLYPGHSIATIDVAIGYEHALCALGHDVHVFNYHNSLAYHSVALEAWAERNPNFHCSQEDMLKIASQDAVVECVAFVPDVALAICGFALHKMAYELIAKRLRVPLAILLTESPYLDNQQALLLRGSGARLAFTNDRNSVAALAEASKVTTVYAPHSFDPVRHYPRNVGPEYQADVFFHGTLYPERKAIFDVIDWTGINAVVNGTRLGDDRVEGALANEELARWYSGSKINLNPHRTVMGTTGEGELQHINRYDAYSLGPRAYEIAACGGFQIADDTRPELREVFGDAVPTFSDASDLSAKIRHYLSHDSERLCLAAAARERVQVCSFEHRAREIVAPCLQELIDRG